jgi:hypothetical protein
MLCNPMHFICDSLSCNFVAFLFDFMSVSGIIITVYVTCFCLLWRTIIIEPLSTKVYINRKHCVRFNFMFNRWERILSLDQYLFCPLFSLFCSCSYAIIPCNQDLYAELESLECVKCF